MSKKFIAALIALTILCVGVFAACTKKNEYVNPATNEKYDLVTNENGERVLSDDGELLVYQKDEDGKLVTDENGEPVTVEQGFIGQLQDGNVVEDYAYKLTLPDGWKRTGDGEFENKSAKAVVSVSFLKYTYSSYVKLKEITYAELAAQGIECKLDNYSGAGISGKRGVVSYNGACIIEVLYDIEGNTVLVRYESEKYDGAEEVLEQFMKAIDYKPYAYYDEVELSEYSVPEEETTEAVSEGESSAEALD